MADPVFVLVRPQMGENIGAAARAMLNFGLERMRVVSPRDGWPNPAAVAMASGAGRVLDTAQLAGSVAEGLQGVTFSFATTARGRDLTKPVYSPEAAMALAAEKIAAGDRVAVLFGPERAGLENEDLAQANALVSVPVNPEFPSLNLAQCVLLMGYEWQRAAGEVTGLQMSGDAELASFEEVDHLAAHYEERMEEAGFFFPDHKAASMKVNLRNMWSRFPMTRMDVRMLHGMMRQLVRWKERG